MNTPFVTGSSPPASGVGLNTCEPAPIVAPAVSLSTGLPTVTYTVEQTLDDPADAGAVWFSHPDATLVGATTSLQGNYAYVPRAARVTVSSGSGTAKLIAIQSGLGRA